MAALMDRGLDELRVPPDPASVSLARRFVGDQLAGMTGPDVIGDLELVVSELVTNAVQYGAPEAIGVTVGVDADRAWVAVTNGTVVGASVAPAADWQLADIEQRAGRGLGIVRAVADDVRVERGDGRVTVRAARRLSC